MKEKISKGYKKYKELKKVPRYNALIKLGLYFIFFLVFGSIFMLNRVPNESKKETVNTNMYSFTYTVNDDIITGKKDNNIEFVYNNIEYKIVNNILSCNLETCEFSYIYLFDLFKPIDINSYIKNGELIYKTEYNDGTLEYKYNIKDKKVNEYFNIDSSFEIIKKGNNYIINLENYNIFDKITLEYK